VQGELRAAPRQRDPHAASVFSRPSSTKTGRSERVYQRAPRALRVEPICSVLGVSASAYYRRPTGARSARSAEDERLLEAICKVHAANYYAYGYRRTWKAPLRAGEVVGRDHVKRLMGQASIQGAKRRGKP
jgi:hypothetical protein